MVHTSCYCGSFEKACLKLEIPMISIAESPITHGFAVSAVANGLLEDGFPKNSIVFNGQLL